MDPISRNEAEVSSSAAACRAEPPLICCATLENWPDAVVTSSAPLLREALTTLSIRLTPTIARQVEFARGRCDAVCSPVT